MIDRYLVEAEKARPLGETKRRTLNAVKNSYLGERVSSDINQQVLVDYALWRIRAEGGGMKLQTAGNDMAHLGSVLSLARAHDVTNQTLDEMRRQMANLQADIEFSVAAVKMLTVEGSAAAEETRVRVLEMLRSVQSKSSTIAEALGGVPKPVRY